MGKKGYKRLLVDVPPEMHKALKRLAVEEETTLAAVVRKALEEWLKKHT